MTVPTNSTLTIHKQTVMVHPIIDEYYNLNPYHSRSSQFVTDKGLVTNEKSTPATTPAPATSMSLHQSLAKTLSPSTAMLSPRENYDPNSMKDTSNTSTISDIRYPTPVATRPTTASSKSGEQGNTKKKRAAPPAPALVNISVGPSDTGASTGTPGLDYIDMHITSELVRTSENTNKLSQYFPEFNTLSRDQ